MKRATFAVIGLFLFSVMFFGCSKSQDVEKIGKLEIQEEGIPKEEVALTQDAARVSPPQETQLLPPTEPKIAPPVAGEQPLESVIITPQGSSQLVGEGIEMNKKIQAALKNANFYNGAIDGKIGPMSKKAIEDFQKSKGLKVDGKVGPVTWRELEKYLQPAPVAAAR